MINRQQLTSHDLYNIAMAEYAVQNPQAGYPDSWWDILDGLDGEVEEHFDNLSEADQQELERRMKEFVPSISGHFEELNSLDSYLDDEDDDEEENMNEDYNDYDETEEEQEREENRRRLIDEINIRVTEEFSDFISENN